MPNRPSPAMQPGSSRSGFTLMELLFAIVIAGIVIAMAFPKMMPMRERAGLRASKQIVMANLATARQAAMSRGAPVTFHIDSNTTWVSAGSGDTLLTARTDLSRENQTMVSSSTVDTVRYNARGLARLDSGHNVIVLQRGAFTDSVCISLLGTVGRCGL